MCQRLFQSWIPMHADHSARSHIPFVFIVKFACLLFHVAQGAYLWNLIKMSRVWFGSKDIVIQIHIFRFEAQNVVWPTFPDRDPHCFLNPCWMFCSGHVSRMPIYIFQILPCVFLSRSLLTRHLTFKLIHCLFFTLNVHPHFHIFCGPQPFPVIMLFFGWLCLNVFCCFMLHMWSSFFILVVCPLWSWYSGFIFRFPLFVFIHGFLRS